MTLIEFEILLDLNGFGGLTAAELRDCGRSRETRTRQGYAAKLVQLERRGFVRRGDTGIWQITERGQEVLAL